MITAQIIHSVALPKVTEILRVFILAYPMLIAIRHRNTSAGRLVFWFTVMGILTNASRLLSEYQFAGVLATGATVLAAMISIHYLDRVTGVDRRDWWGRPKA